MNIHLISCDNCATVFDANKLKFPDDVDPIYTEGVPDTHKIYDQEQEDWVHFTRCPVCKEPIPQPAL